MLSASSDVLLVLVVFFPPPVIPARTLLAPVFENASTETGPIYRREVPAM